MRIAIILILPAVFLLASLVVRAAVGPFWMWHTLDPAYFYLLDALNMVNLTTPGVMVHPGTTVQALGALVLFALYPVTGAEEITAAVLSDPERHLRVIGDVILVLNAGALAVLGAVTLRAFGSLLPAMMIQTGPFLSMIVLKHGLSVKPEALLIFAMTVAAMVSVAALRPGALDGRRRNGFAVAFGLVAGFAIATKVTAVLVFVFPVFLLGRPRVVGVYGLALLGSTILFTLPAAGAYPAFFDWLTTAVMTSGPHTAGAHDVIDWALYPAGLYKQFVRPIFSGTIVLSLAILALAWWRHRRGRTVPGLEARLLAGVVLAQVALALAVAKQPTAYYMIPAWMLVPLAWLLLYRMATGMDLGLARNRPRFVTGMAVLLTAIGISQVFSVVRVVREFSTDRAFAFSVDNRRFDRCARVYFYSVSSLSYAFQIGGFLTKSFMPQIAAAMPANDYWFEKWWAPARVTFRGWEGPLDFTTEVAKYPCLYIRGLKDHSGPVVNYIKKVAPGLKLNRACSVGPLAILTAGVDCNGALLKGQAKGKNHGQP